MTALREIASGLAFPEGPVCMPDGSVVLSDKPASGARTVATDTIVLTAARGAADAERDYWRQQAEAFNRRQEMRDTERERRLGVPTGSHHSTQADTASFYLPAMKACLEWVGPNQIALGTDYAHRVGDPEGAIKAVVDLGKQANLSQDQVDRILLDPGERRVELGLGRGGIGCAAAPAGDVELRRPEQLLHEAQLVGQPARDLFGRSVAGGGIEDGAAAVGERLEHLTEGRDVLLARHRREGRRAPEADHRQLLAARGNRTRDQTRLRVEADARRSLR